MPLNRKDSHQQVPFLFLLGAGKIRICLCKSALIYIPIALAKNMRGPGFIREEKKKDNLFSGLFLVLNFIPSFFFKKGNRAVLKETS